MLEVRFENEQVRVRIGNEIESNMYYFYVFW